MHDLHVKSHHQKCIKKGDFPSMLQSLHSINPIQTALLRQNRRIQLTMPQPVTKCLVICGARSPSESQLFGTFLGICRALKLKTLGMEGDIWSCAPTHEYLNAQNESVKFGTQGI